MTEHWARPDRRCAPLSGPWTLHVDPDGPTAVPPEARNLVGRTIPARVPGGVHDDLQRAGIIADPFVGAGEAACAWVSRTDWAYRTTAPMVDPGGADRVDLVFEGLDTVARITLGGVEVGRARNMFRRYRFDVTEPVRRGERDLVVHLASAYTEAEAFRGAVGPRPNAYPEPFNFIRKMACSFGWDWGITMPGAGIWRAARLETWSTARISGLRAGGDLVDGAGVLDLVVDVERSGAAADPLEVRVSLDGIVCAVGTVEPDCGRCALTATIPRVRPWRPRGYGDAALYPVEVCLLGADGAVLDRALSRVGFRHLGLDRTGDADGTPFTFTLDGAQILIKGVNWIPGDLLPGRMTRERYATLLTAAADANVNLIRVWGGGIYETDEFYDLCDELGLLVWQDFPFACAAYPEDEPLAAEVRAESAENVVRLSSHPCLAIWNGNNENQWLRLAEAWADQPGGDKPWGETYYHDVLPRTVARLDPSRPYTESSPWSGSSARYPNDPAHQTFHSWDVWNRQDYRHYRDSVPRFVSEFGWQAPPAWRTLRDAAADDPLTPTSPGVLLHQKATGGMGKLRRGLAPHAPVPDDFDAWHYLMQWNQVRAIETGVLHWRSHWPRCAGTILWQWHDLWPVISWSAIDGAGRRKPLYFALREMYAPRAVTIQPHGGGLEACVLNDSPDTWAGEAVVRRVGDAGVDLARRILPFVAEPRSVVRLSIPAELTEFDEPASEVLIAQADGLRSTWYPTEAKDSDFVGAPPRLDIRQTAQGLTVAVTATTMLRDALIQADRIHPDASADRGFFTLLPGETCTIHIACPEPLSPAALETPWAIAFLDSVLRG